MPFRTKPEIARAMIARALDVGVPCNWVLGDEVYGADRRLRMMLEGRGQPYLLAIRSNETSWGRSSRARSASTRRRRWPKPCRRGRGGG